MLETPRNEAGSVKLWLSWALTSTLAFSLGGGVGAALSPTRDIIVSGYLALTISILLAGLLQWPVLRPRAIELRSWVLASVAAVIFMALVVFGVGGLDRDVGWVLGVVAGWSVLGGLQWRVLRGHLAGAGWWVAAHIAALVAAGPVVGFVSWATGAPVLEPIGGLLRWAGFGLAYGGVTATALLGLVRRGPEPAMS